MSNSRWEGESDRRNKIDPKSLVITKSISRREAPSAESLVIQSNTSNQRNTQQRHQQQQQRQPQQQQQQPQQDMQVYQNQPSHTSYNNSPPIQQSIPQSGSRKIVLLCNLDPRATAADVGVNYSIYTSIIRTVFLT